MNKYEYDFIHTEALENINRLYINTRSQHLILSTKGTYNTVKATYSPKRKNLLLDWQIQKHLNQQMTIGVFASTNNRTKFQTIDIDVNDKELVARIYNYLLFELGFPKEAILVSRSGKKGYHIDIFYTEMILVSTTIKLHKHILNELQLNPAKVEHRPTQSVGVKLPFGCHFGNADQRTNIAVAVEMPTFREMSPTVMNEIVPMDAERYLDMDFNDADKQEVPKNQVRNLKRSEGITEGLDKQMETVVRQVDAVAYTFTNAVFDEILTKGHLIESGTRNNVSFELTGYLMRNGYSKEEAIGTVSDILMNTFLVAPENISCTREYALSELERVTKRLYIGQVTDSRKLELTKEEIAFTLVPKQLHLKKLTLSLLLHNIAIGTTGQDFYMAYSKLAEYGHHTDRVKLLKHLKELEDLGILVIVQHGKKRAGGRVEDNNVFETNIYKLNAPAYDIEAPTYKVDSWDSLVTEANEAFGKELPKVIGNKNQYYRAFKI